MLNRQEMKDVDGFMDVIITQLGAKKKAVQGAIRYFNKVTKKNNMVDGGIDEDEIIRFFTNLPQGGDISHLVTQIDEEGNRYSITMQTTEEDAGIFAISPVLSKETPAHTVYALSEKGEWEEADWSYKYGMTYKQTKLMLGGGPKSLVLLTVTANGNRISDEDLSKIFKKNEPIMELLDTPTAKALAGLWYDRISGNIFCVPKDPFVIGSAFGCIDEKLRLIQYIPEKYKILLDQHCKNGELDKVAGRYRVMEEVTAKEAHDYISSNFYKQGDKLLDVALPVNKTTCERFAVGGDFG